MLTWTPKNAIYFLCDQGSEVRSLIIKFSRDCLKWWTIFSLLKLIGERNLQATPSFVPPPRPLDGLPSCRLSLSKELCSSKGPRASWVGQREYTVEKDSWKQWYACLSLVKLLVGSETWHLKRKQALCKLTRPKEKRAGRMPSPRAAPAHSWVIDTC